jgi:hypothetical protein
MTLNDPNRLTVVVRGSASGVNTYTLTARCLAAHCAKHEEQTEQSICAARRATSSYMRRNPALIRCPLIDINVNSSRKAPIASMAGSSTTPKSHWGYLDTTMYPMLNAIPFR